MDWMPKQLSIKVDAVFHPPNRFLKISLKNFWIFSNVVSVTGSAWGTGVEVSVMVGGWVAVAVGVGVFVGVAVGAIVGVAVGKVSR